MWVISQMRAIVAAFLVVVLTLVAGSPRAAFGQQTGMQAEDLHRLKSVSQVRIAPDGKKILYSVVSREEIELFSQRSVRMAENEEVDHKRGEDHENEIPDCR